MKNPRNFKKSKSRIEKREYFISIVIKYSDNYRRQFVLGIFCKLETMLTEEKICEAE